jgi:hypothetical protein
VYIHAFAPEYGTTVLVWRKWVLSNMSILAKLGFYDSSKQRKQNINHRHLKINIKLDIYEVDQEEHLGLQSMLCNDRLQCM